MERNQTTSWQLYYKVPKINDNDASAPMALQPYSLFNSVTSELTCKHTMSELGFG